MSAIFGMIGDTARAADGSRDLSAMSAALAHRGPDSAASHLDRIGGVALGFRFLAAAPFELAPGVLFNEDRSIAMVCDGHVFNAPDVRSWLQGKGHVLRGSHSSELLLHLYEEE